MNGPLVSVICLCYNHEKFVVESLQSVIAQTYPNIEIIVMDDASADDSVAVIEKFIYHHPQIRFVKNKTNRGNCISFNQGFRLSKGKYIVDFATDDLMDPERVQKQVDCLQSLDSTWGVVFTDAAYIDEGGFFIRNHYEHLLDKRLIKHVPSGDVYRAAVAQYFIAAPTMMVKREVLESLGGYDEALAYEDFDFWVRSSRKFKYCFLNERLTKIRKWKNSMSSTWYIPGDRQLHSTYIVCEKALALNDKADEDEALTTRARFELRQSVFSENLKEAKLFYGLLKKMNRENFFDYMTISLGRLKIPFAPLRQLYHRIRYIKG